MSDLPIICVLGEENVELQTLPCPEFETREMDIRCFKTDDNIMSVLAQNKPVAIVSVGDISAFKNLLTLPERFKRMWIHFDSKKQLENNGQQVFNHFFLNAVFPKCEKPVVSVFTPAYKTGDKIWKPFLSLMAQTYVDWEWIIIDDSDDGGETFDRLSEIANMDGRVRLFKEHKHSGKIGQIKKMACKLASGKYLVELDHDDELTPNALKWIVEAFEAHPEAGFVYTDFAECFEDGTPFVYPDGWGMGYGSYREEVHGGMKYMVVNAPNINPKTIRHIVAAPNHIRAWRKRDYDMIGGHRDLLHVVDDYELIVRTFLTTRMVRIPRMCYIQYRNLDGSGNTHRSRNKEIQRLVRHVSMVYDVMIHGRFEELGIFDYMWGNDNVPPFYKLTKIGNPSVEQHCTITYEPKT